MLKYLTPTDKLLIQLSERNIGNTPQHHQLAGLGHQLAGRYYSAYQEFVTAALHDHEYAKFVIGTLNHFGCTDALNIWKGLSSKQRTGKLNGDEYPANPSTLTNIEIAHGRKALEEGHPPELSATCPLTLYMNKQSGI